MVENLPLLGSDRGTPDSEFVVSGGTLNQKNPHNEVFRAQEAKGQERTVRKHEFGNNFQPSNFATALSV